MTENRKIGVLFGQENTFPHEFVDRVNGRNEPGIEAEFVNIDKVIQADACPYAVIVDRISQDIPFYRAYLKNAALSGTLVINNPFWWSADEKFFNNALAETIGVKVPKTVLLPSNEHPPDTNEMSMRNLAYPLDWDSIFAYIGFPAYFKPFSGGGWKNVHRVENAEDLFEIYNRTGQLVMMLQEEIDFSDYYRCYCVGRERVLIMEYDPRKPYHEQYAREDRKVDPQLQEVMEEAVLKLNQALGYDLNTVELAIREGEPYAIDFCNPAPDADYYSVGEKNFDWIVEAIADLTIKLAKKHQPGRPQIDWGTFVRNSLGGERE